MGRGWLELDYFGTSRKKWAGGGGGGGRVLNFGSLIGLNKV